MKKAICFFILIVFTLAGCGVTQPTIAYISSQTPTATHIITATKVPTLTMTPTTGLTVIPDYTQTVAPTLTRTPYPIPPEILSRDELQKKIDEWVSGEIVLTDADRDLDEKTGKPIRLGILAAPLLKTVIFDFYNLGYTIIEDNNGTPYLLNIVGFEDGSRQRFTFPFHNGKLFSKYTLIILGEFKGKRINYGNSIYYDRLLPLQFLQKSKDIVGFVNGGTTNIGSPDYGNEGDTFMETSKNTTEALTNFLLCDTCLVKDIPTELEKYVNQIPEQFEPSLAFLWVYTVSY